MTSLKLFLQKSYKEVTMKEIVNSTGLSKGAFYHYFESKEQLFHEIIDHFFNAILKYDFKTLPGDSLNRFFYTYAGEVNRLRFQFLVNGTEEGEDFLTFNFFSLLFDAIRLFPEFRTKLEAYHEKELKAWTGVIRTARDAGEIRTPLTNEQVARIFLFTGDGLTMNLTMERRTGDIGRHLISMWTNIYETLAAR